MTDLNDDELLRYSRQILLDGWDMDAQINLKNSRVLIVGVGGLGCPVSQILVRAGVGCVYVLDFDVIEQSNLQRQTLFGDQDVGKHKALVATNALKKHNPLIDVHCLPIRLDQKNIHDVLKTDEFDLLIDCTDNFAIRDLLNKTCRKKNLPLLSASAIGEVGQIALFTKETGCYGCLFGDDDGDTQTCTTSGVLSSTVHVIGSMSAQVALDFLGRGNNPIAGQLLLWQGKTMTLKKVAFMPNQSCPVCQPLPDK